MNQFRKAIRAHEVLWGSWAQIGHPTSVEILANAGYDWVGIDCEHTDIDLSALTNMMRGMTASAAAPLIRVRDTDVIFIRQVLDLGAAGVIVPMVDSAESVKRAVGAAKYPPEGIRGYCYSRMNRYGKDFDEYAASANDHTVVIAMIETKAGVDNIEDILAVEGLDGVFLGPYDLSGAYGLPGQLDHPIVRKARTRVLKACLKRGRTAGMHIVHPNPEVVRLALAEGFTFLALGADIIALDQVARSALSSARKGLIRSGETKPLNNDPIHTPVTSMTRHVPTPLRKGTATVSRKER
jgi:2-dehydro-3-deoxyglucarate aldolase